MQHHTTEYVNSETIIDNIDVTDDTLTSRGGLSLFVRYLRGIALYPHLERLFGTIRKTAKGQPVCEVFKQLFCFLLDGTSRHLVAFDRLKKDEGYAGAIESEPAAMLSSHAVKRFFKAFWWPRIYLFRHLLQRLFLWRLQMVEPLVVVLGLDTMVMDNSEAAKRHGVKPTYKKVKGFQPLQMSWGRFIVDAVFRAGDKHSNHADTAEKMVRHVVKKIRKHYRECVPIIVRLDSGFFDQKLFRVFEELEIGYICCGKLYGDLTAYVASLAPGVWSRYQKGEIAWDFVEFGDRRGSWKVFRRAIFCRPLCEQRQYLLEFARPDRVLYTNLGRSELIDERLAACGMLDLVKPEAVIETYHGRGSDELIHRALKDFSAEELPFKRFAQNAAFYYTMLVAFFLYETFKEDVCIPVVKLTSYATTLRRRVIDIAAKVVRHAGKITLKVTTATWKGLNFGELWHRSGAPPSFAWA
jgi:hypothetical protein